MTTITNSKIETLRPSWKAFSGMSLLFDNPGESLSPLHEAENQNIQKIDCSPEITFYQRIYQSLTHCTRDLEASDSLLCKLPYSSYHITVNDLANKVNLKDFKSASNTHFSKILKAFPDSLPQSEVLLPFLRDTLLIKKKDWGIRFQFSHLWIWRDNVLVVRLVPADDQSKIKFRKLSELRKTVNDDFQKIHGYSRSFKETYAIHLTLAYFGNQDYGKTVVPLLEDWNNYFLKAMKDETGCPLIIEFNSISLYGFTDMATFFKID